jgi:hypothetical protein
MVRVSTSLIFVAAAAAAHAPALPAQELDRNAQQQIQNIARERRPEMEAAARAFIYNVAPNRFGPAGEGPVPVPVLDELKRENLDAYWMEVAQLAVQFQMFQNVVQRDTARARQMSVVFGTEFEARILQRAWRTATEAQRRTLRTQLEALMTRHFEAEDQLRGLEMRDIERRLADARAETDRRRARRAELVRWAVDDIIHQAGRPEQE